MIFGRNMGRLCGICCILAAKMGITHGDFENFAGRHSRPATPATKLSLLLVAYSVVFAWTPVCFVE